MAETHVVVRDLPGPGGKVISPGVRVDASAWPNKVMLTRVGYIRPLLAEEVTKARPIRGKE